MTLNLAALIAIFAIAGTQIARAKGPGLTGSDWSQVRAEYERHQHSITSGPEGWQAPNRGQQWLTRFDGRGFSVEPNHGGWHWGLDLRKYGFEGAERGIHGKARVSVAKDRATYDWGAGLEEWYHNSAAGLEHGYTLHRRPEGGNGPLRLTLAVRGGLRPKVAGGTDVAFLNAQGGVALNYAGLKVTDATGRRLSAWFTADEQGLRLNVDERGARYPVTIDPTAQQAYLKPAAVGTTQAGDAFGYAVAISGDTLVVGAYLEESSTTGVNSTPNESAPAGAGAVYVFTRTAGVWSQQAYLKPAAVGTTQNGDRFGESVAISGDTLVVGAPNEDSSTTGVNSTPNESAVDAGAAYVFTRTAGVWSQQAYLKPAAVGATQAGDTFGESVAISGDTVVVGAFREDSSTTGVNSTPNESASAAGAVYVFTRTAGVWSQQAYLKPAAVGSTQAGDRFGESVAISGDTLVVGALQEASSTTGVNSTPNESANSAGAAYVFIRTSGVWSQQAYLKPAAVGATQVGDGFGGSVAISGDSLVVGANSEDSSTTGVDSTPNESANGAGAAYVFTRTSGAWSQQAYLKPAAVGTTQAGDTFGVSVAISGDRLVVGANNEASSTTGVNSTPNESAAFAGAAYVFTRTSGVWSQQEYLKPAVVGTTQAGDAFGSSVAISGDTLVVGARQEASSTTGVNSSPNESANSAGAAYVFTSTGVAVNLTASGGTPQSAAVNAAFATSLQATVTDGSGNPVSGVTVNFTAPGSGASAVLSAASAVTNGSGVASVNATANATAGSYVVTANAGAASATFSLTNLAQGPVPPTITAPANGSTVTTTVVTFSWTAVAGATKYELKLIEANTPQQFRVELLGNNATSAVYTIPSGSYRMEVKACDAAGCGAAAVSTFVLQGGAVPPGPVTGVGCQVVNASSQNQLNCNWTALAGAHFYFINVVQPGAGPGGGALTVAGRQVGGTSVSILIPNGQAVVLVRGCTGDGCGPFSTGVNINASIGNPLTPVLGEPFAGSSVDSGANAPNVTFSWNRVAGDTGSNFRYRLYVQDFARNQPALDVITPDNFYGAYFNPGTRYDALVIAIPTGGGAPRQGPPSAFVIRGRVPKSPVMTQPSYSSTVTRDGQGQVTVAWTPLVNNDGTVSLRNYQYFFNGPSQFSGITTATTISLPLTPGNWLGIVRACTTGTTCTANSAAGWGPWNNEAGSEGGQAAFTVAP